MRRGSRPHGRDLRSPGTGCWRATTACSPPRSTVAIVAAVSTVLALGLGVSGALGLEGLRARHQDVIERAIMLPLVIPEVMMGVALMLFFVTIKMPLTLATVIIGHVVFNVPLVMVIVRARLRKLDRRLTEAARDLGASRWQVFHRVTEPLLRPAILGPGLIALTVSLDDFNRDVLRGGARRDDVAAQGVFDDQSRDYSGDQCPFGHRRAGLDEPGRSGLSCCNENSPRRL